jgi:hypothetical protein
MKTCAAAHVARQPSTPWCCVCKPMSRQPPNPETGRCLRFTSRWQLQVADPLYGRLGLRAMTLHGGPICLGLVFNRDAKAGCNPRWPGRAAGCPRSSADRCNGSTGTTRTKVPVAVSGAIGLQDCSGSDRYRLSNQLVKCPKPGESQTRRHSPA